MTKQVIIKLSDRLPHVESHVITTRGLRKKPNTVITFDATYDPGTGTYLVSLVLADDEDDDDNGTKFELDTVLRPPSLDDRFLVPLSSLTEGMLSIELLISQGLCETAKVVSFSRPSYSTEVTVLVKALDQDFGLVLSFNQIDTYFDYVE